MTDKLIAMPTDDEMYTAFTHALQVAVPENKKNIVQMFDKFIERAKEHLNKVVLLTTEGLACNLTEETGNQLLEGFIKSQSFLLKLPLRGLLMTYGADTFSHFIKSTNSGTNNKDVTINGLYGIMVECFHQLGQKYAIYDTDEQIKAKIVALFADKAV